jgi:hypothetical protein
MEDGFHEQREDLFPAQEDPFLLQVDVGSIASTYSLSTPTRQRLNIQKVEIILRFGYLSDCNPFSMQHTTAMTSIDQIPT